MTAGSDRVRDALLELLSGYWYSQCLYVLAELGLADRLERGPASAAELAKDCDAHPESLFRFLRALGDAGLVLRIGEDRFATTPLLALLTEDHPGSLRPLARLGGHPLHWQAWGGLLQAIRSGDSAFGSHDGKTFYEALGETPAAAALFGQVMRSGDFLDEEILAGLELPESGLLVDIGGAGGGLLEKILGRRPDLEGLVFDLAPSQAEAPGAGIEYRQGDFLDGVPAGGAAYILKFVLHNWDDARALRILKHCRQAMGAGSRLFLVELLLPAWDRPSHANRHDLNMLVLTSGRERTGAQYEALLEAARLRLEGSVETPSGVTVMTAGPVA